eukprot:528040_1
MNMSKRNHTNQTIQPTLTDPDKFGLLIQCRMKMDKLSNNELYNYANSTLKLLSTKQLKKFLFTGLNAIKTDTSYNKLFQMRLLINQIIEEAETLKKRKSKSKPKAKINIISNEIIENPNPTIPIVPKNASLSKMMPFDIISNNICPYLKMSSITKLAKCDRKLAIICHTPTSINNLMHRYDMYKYNKSQQFVTIDGHYDSLNNCDVSNMHRFKNIETLSIDLDYLNDANKIQIFNSFRRVKHLSIDDIQETGQYPWRHMNAIQVMPLLQTISFINTNQTDNIIYFLKQYKNTNNNINNYYNQIIYQLTSIAFIDCDLSCTLYDQGYGDDDDPEMFAEYKNIVNFILPSQPNNLQVLKFENSYLIKTDHIECTNANNEFENINRIKLSLANLKGFVYGQSFYDDNDNLFFNLAHRFLSNLSLFNKLNTS